MSDSVVSKMKIVMARVAVFFGIAWWCVPLFGRSRGVLPAAAGSSFLLAPQLASGFNTNHTSTTTAAFAKTATLHPLASSLDGLLWKKRRLGVVYTSLAGRRLLGHQLQPFVAALTEAAGATQHI